MPMPLPMVNVNWREFVPGPQHGIIDFLLVYLILVLYKHGIKFDIRIWRNGKETANGRSKSGD